MLFQFLPKSTTLDDRIEGSLCLKHVRHGVVSY